MWPSMWKQAKTCKSDKLTVCSRSQNVHKCQSSLLEFGIFWINIIYDILTKNTRRFDTHMQAVSPRWVITHAGFVFRDKTVIIKGVDNVGARGALAPPDFYCVNMYKALNIWKKNSYKTTQHMVTSCVTHYWSYCPNIWIHLGRNHFLIDMIGWSLYMHSHMCERKERNPGSGHGLKLFHCTLRTPDTFALPLSKSYLHPCNNAKIWTDHISTHCKKVATFIGLK